MSAQSGNAAAPHDQLDHRIRTALASIDAGTPMMPAVALPTSDARSTSEADLRAFDAMAGSRLLDISARRLREHGVGYYTIGSAGHESNALVAMALRPDDPALLHYRSGAFFLARSLQAGRTLADGLRAILLSMFASTADVASGGRHKVFGDASLAVIPQTSTIASHLPRAVGVALAISRARKVGVAGAWAPDAITVCSFGDASLNHSTAAGALNTAGYAVAQGLALPLLFVCEDNGIGISVPTPAGWVAAAAHRPGIDYLPADGADPDDLRDVAAQAVRIVREQRRPVLLHLRTVRYLSHAGSDVETAYRNPAQIVADAQQDPLLALARRIGSGHALRERYHAIATQVDDIAEGLRDTPTLTDATAVIEPLLPPTAPRPPAPPTADHERRTALFGRLPEDGAPLTLAQSINTALTDAMAARPGVLVFGEDVARKGGVYGVTRTLAQRFGAARVFDTLLDEQSILGFALGLGVSGLLPVPEIQYLAYLHNAEDQLRGEAASLRFFSNGAYRNPMVVRIAGLAYQKGFGGHFHNDNAVGVLRDIPGLLVAVPACAADAPAMLRACLDAADGGRVSVFLEPIALYHERDLHRAGDRGWLAPYSPDDVATVGAPRRYGSGTDLCLVTFGNGVRMSLRVAHRLGVAGISVLDLRWVAPIHAAELLGEVENCRAVLVVDETRHGGGVGEGVLSALVEGGYRGRMARVASRDSFVPLGAAADLVLLGEPDIERAARDLLQA